MTDVRKLAAPSLAMKRDVNVNVSLNKERPAIAVQASPGSAAYVGNGCMLKDGGEDVDWVVSDESKEYEMESRTQLLR